jgi:hypothetical protein
LLKEIPSSSVIEEPKLRFDTDIYEMFTKNNDDKYPLFVVVLFCILSVLAGNIIKKIIF